MAKAEWKINFIRDIIVVAIKKTGNTVKTGATTCAKVFKVSTNPVYLRYPGQIINIKSGNYINKFISSLIHCIFEEIYYLISRKGLQNWHEKCPDLTIGISPFIKVQ